MCDCDLLELEESEAVLEDVKVGPSRERARVPIEVTVRRAPARKRHE